VPRPIRLLAIVVALAVVIAVITLVFGRPAKTEASQVITTTTVPCQSPRLGSDYQIDQCLEKGIRTMTRRMNSSLRRESSYLSYASRAQDWRVAQRTQAAFIAYAREECLSQANPYQPGTIVPILYGECVIQLYQQRLDNIQRAIATFKNGGESQRSS
jgi:uncharacterized protein YecT (DUF1311 family)